MKGVNRKCLHLICRRRGHQVRHTRSRLSMKRKLLSIIGILGIIPSLFAQLPPNQPEQDCFNAIPVCNAIYNQPNAYQGEGLNPLEIDSQFSCLGFGERNDVWYILTVQQAGDLAFTLTPDQLTDDYDWAVYNLTNNSCSDIRSMASLEVSCNFMKEPGATGPNGNTGGQFEPVIPVMAGETYVINVSNFEGSTTGYTLDFTASTASILDTSTPAIESLNFDCNEEELQLSFTENVLCSSVEVADFALTGPGGPYTITAVSSTDCSSGAGFSRTFSLAVSPVIIEPGNFTLSLIGEVTDNCGNNSVFSSESFVQAFPQIDAGVDLGACENEDEVQLDATITSSFDVATISWTCDKPECGLVDAGVEDPSIEISLVESFESIKYYLNVSDVNGCASSTDSVVLSILPVPVVNAGEDQLICELGPGVQLSGTPADGNEAPLPFQFNWFVDGNLEFDNVANPFARPAESTTYLLQVSSLNGCVSTATANEENTVTVNVSPLPEVNAGLDQEICVGDTVLLSAALLSGGGAYEYEWTPANTGFIAFPDSSKTLASPDFTTLYFVVAKDSVCTSLADSIRVTVNPLPELSLGQDQSICLGEETNIVVSTSIPDNFSNTWFETTGLDFSTGSLNPTASPDTTTEYSVITESVDGCISDTARVTIEVRPSPLVEIIPRDTTICRGDTISLLSEAFFTTTPEVIPVTYRWDNVPGTTGSRVDPILRVSPSEDVQTFGLTVSNSGDCPFRDSVTVRTVASADIRVQTDTSEICEGDQIQLVATGGANAYTYDWTGSKLNSNSGSTVSATPDTTTTFLLAATDGVCVINDSLRIRVFPTPDAAYIFGEPEGCLGLDFQVQAAGEPGVLYIWDFGDGTPVVNDILTVHTYDRAGLFTVNLTAIGERGCEATNTDVQVEVRDTVSAAFTSSPVENELLYLPVAEVSLTDASPNAVQWFWDFGDGSFSTDQNPSYTYTEAGVYGITLIATDDLGCVSRITKIPYEVREPVLFIPNVFSPNEDGLHDTYVVKYEGGEETMIKIFDRWGNLHFEATSFLDSWDGKSDGSDAPEGVYFYSIVVGDRSYEGELTLLR